jgi:hypothetical protein
LKTVLRLVGWLVLVGQTTLAQTTPSPPDGNGPKSSASTAPATNVAPCANPAPLFEVEDYSGPLNKTVAYFARKVEIKTVRAPRPTSVRLCALNPREKFVLFLHNTLEPVVFVSSAFTAGSSQADNDDPTFGQGAAGYGKRFAAALTDNVSSDFFHTFFYPVIFRQDPRYYRQGDGAFRGRLGHALSHVFVARSDSGGRMFNFSEWLGTTSQASLSNLYHPGNERGFGSTAGRVGIGIGTDMGFDVLREFWPEIVRKLKLPFRTTRDTQNTTSSPRK